MSLPEHGRTSAEVLDDLTARHSTDLPTHGGRTWAYVYDSGLPDLDPVMDAARSMYGAVNGLDPTVFTSIVALENDVVGTVLDLVQAPTGAVGTFTSGGTESCMLAVKAARDARPGVERPNLVAPTTVHAAFVKGAEYFGLEIRLVQVDQDTFRADPAAMAAAIDDSTVLVVCSAVSYAHGVCDPVPEIASAAAARGVPCHVDGCIGGWVLLVVPQAGHRRAGLGLLRRRGHVDLGRPAQVRVRRRRERRPCSSATPRCAGRRTSRRPTGPATR